MHRPMGLLLILVAISSFYLATNNAAQLRPAANATGACIPQEMDALLAFKNGITNDSNHLLASWRRGRDCCKWGGVTCSNQTGYVLKLELHDATLEGQISPSLFSLEYLEYLDLRNTSLLGINCKVPNFFGSLKNLRHLDISNTYLCGRLPSTLGNLSKLEYLDLSGTMLSGPVPPQLGNLSKLQTLHLGGTGSMYSRDISWLTRLQSLEELHMHMNLSLVYDWPYVMNTIPSLKSISLLECYLSSASQPLAHINLTKLTWLDLSFNNLDHPAATGWFWNVTSLVSLDLLQTYLYGPIPHAIGRMVSLEWLDFSMNGNKATMDVDLKDLCALKYLFIDGSLSSGSINNLVEKFPRCTSNKLRFFSSCDNNLTGFLPDRMMHLNSLASLSIKNNSITGNIPSEIGILDILTYLDLSSNQLSGQIPKLPKSLQFLDLSMNSLSGPLPLDFGAPNIVEISLFSNYITGHVPEFICHLQDLAILDLCSNFLHGELPQCFHMTNMSFLLLSNNSFSGKFPSSPQSWSRLSFIDLARNKIHGTLPHWIGELVDLKVLLLSDNMLYGDIPVSITNLSRLRLLSLAGNHFSATIPWSVQNFVAMSSVKDTSDADLQSWWERGLARPFDDHVSLVIKKQDLKYGFSIFDVTGIDLSRNNLTGGIPEDITSLKGLRYLNLSWNQLVGKIPEKIGGMELLESLDLSRNNLFLEIPPSLSNLTYLGYLDLSYNNLTGRIPTGRQLDTLYTENPSMYDGNSGLCGPPLPKNCFVRNASGNGYIKKGEINDEQMFFYSGLGSGFAVGLFLVLCYVLFKRTW